MHLHCQESTCCFFCLCAMASYASFHGIISLYASLAGFNKLIKFIPTPDLTAKFQTLAISSTPVMFGESEIGQHLLDNPICTKNCNDEKFTILSFGHSSFH